MCAWVSPSKTHRAVLFTVHRSMTHVCGENALTNAEGGKEICGVSERIINFNDLVLEQRDNPSGHQTEILTEVF